MAEKRYLNFDVISGSVLGVDVYRGYANLCDLAMISKADIYDQKKNPVGTQRDLSPKHSRDAYSYAKTKDLKFWPEIFLCLRNKDTVKFIKSSRNHRQGKIKIDLEQIKDGKIAISRVDGNHRLHFADGKSKGYPKIEEETSFCLAYNLSIEEEISLFRDINNNQRRMNTSHLDNIEVKLTRSNDLKNRDPALYIAEQLNLDAASPFKGRIYKGGVKTPECFLPLRSVKSGIQILLSHAKKLTALQDVDVQYKVIQTYFNALKKWESGGWDKPKEYIMLRGVGFWSVCFIGADVIDRVLGEGKYAAKDMLEILNSGKKWDWTRNGDFKGYGGQIGAKSIRDLVICEFENKDGLTIKDLAKRIMKE